MANERDTPRSEHPTVPVPPCVGVPSDALPTLAQIAAVLDILPSKRFAMRKALCS